MAYTLSCGVDEITVKKTQLLRNFNVQVARQDDRRIKVIANGLVRGAASNLQLPLCGVKRGGRGGGGEGSKA